MLRTLSRHPRIGAVISALALVVLPAGAASAAPAGSDAPIVAAGQAPSTEPSVQLPGTLGPAERTAPRIVGGATIAITEVPWQVFLDGDTGPGGETYTCGGSILNPTTILTAAHCTEPLKNLLAGQSLTVRAGVSNVGAPGGQQSQATSIKVHPYYDAVGPVATTGDISVVTISPALTLGSAEVQAIALPTPWTPATTLQPIPGQLKVSGFGLAVDGGTSIDGLLRGVATAPSDPENCTANAENAIAICARSTLGSSCQGDSGGPLVALGATPVQVGVVSNGGRCGPGTDDFYVSLLAPENRAFVDAVLANPAVTPPAPPKAPRGASGPSISSPSSFRVGDTVTCNAGTITGAPTEIRVEFARPDGTVLQSSAGPNAQLVLPASAAGSRLVCRAFATNAGGTYVSPRFTTAATVTPAPIAATPPPTPPATTGTTTTGLPTACPNSLDRATVFSVKVKAPRSARRGQQITVRVSRFGPPQGAHGVVVGIEGPKKILATGSARFASTGQPAREQDLEEYVAIKVRIPRSLKVGKRYTFRGTMLVANTVDEIGSERVCEYGSKAFTVKIRR